MIATRNGRPLVVLDGLLVNSRPTGVGRSILELCSALGEEDRGLDFLVLATEPEMFGFLVGKEGWQILDCPGARGGTLRKALFTQFKVPGLIRAHGGSILHSLQFVAPFHLPCRSVVTVHDLAWLDYPGTVEQPRRTYYRLTVPRTLRQADAIVTNSKATAGDTARLFPSTRDRLRVTPFGTPSWVWRQPQEPVSLRPGPGYFLFVGTLEPRKNLEALLSAYEVFLDTELNQGRAPETIPTLLLVGGKGWKDTRLRHQIRRLQERRFLDLHDYCDPDQLWQLYRRAYALLFPSLHEGFGFPILEAMAAELPVLTANRGAMAEVGGDRVLAVNPDEIPDIARGMTDLVRNQALRQDLARGGPEHARQWSWNRTADLTAQVYRELLEGSAGKK